MVPSNEPHPSVLLPTGRDPQHRAELWELPCRKPTPKGVYLPAWQEVRGHFSRSRGSGACRGGAEQCADQPTRRVTGGSERTQAAVQVWRVWAAIVPQRSLWCANWQVEARVTYRRRRSDVCLTGILPSDVMFLTGSAGGLSACRTGEAPKPVPAAALISSPRAWRLPDEMAPRAVARCRRGRAADGRT